MAISPITSPPAIRPATPQPVLTGQMQQYPIMSAGNQLVQIIQGPQLISQQQQQRQHIMQSPNQYVPTSVSSMTTTASKQNKLPQQILPKPAASTGNSGSMHQTSTAGKSVITQAKMANPVSIAMAPQLTHSTLQQPIMSTATAQPQQATSSPIILPASNLNHSLLLNQMPVLVQQNTPQGVQLILRPPTPQLSAAPSLVIHNSRPQQIQQAQQPQQLLRILNTNGQMQLATATPTFIMSSQANLIQQNLQSIKAQTTANPLNSLQGLTSQTPQQLAAAINGQIIGRSMAQIQNLQLNGNIAHIQMPNGLNGQFISQLPAQFQQSLAGFNQFSQLSSANFQQLATAAAASGASFQSPPPQNQTNDMVVTGQNIQFATQQTPINVSIAQSMPTSQMISMQTAQPQIISTSVTTSEPMRNPTPITIMPPNTVIVPDSKPIVSHIIPSRVGTPATHETQQSPAAKPAKKPKKPKAKKGTAPTTPVYVQKSMQPTVSVPSQQSVTTTSNTSSLSTTTSTGKLDLANVMKLCGIMEDDDDFMDTDDMLSMQSYDPNVTTTPSSTANDIMVTIPYSTGSDMPYSITIPSMDCASGASTIDVSKAVAASRNLTATTSTPSPSLTSTSAQDHKKIGERQYMIKIDNNDGTPGFPLSISLPQNIALDDNDMSKFGNSSSMPMVSTASSQSQAHNAMPQLNSIATSAPMVAPTLQSQINEIQNQLMGVTAIHNGLPANTAAVSTAQPTTAVSTPASTPKAGKKKPAAKKNGKKILETINVPSQIGNIQISQVDSKKPPANNGGKSQTIENQIQITPIIDPPKSTTPIIQYSTHSTVSQQPQYTIQTQQSQHHQSQPQISINLQPNQQILNLPNNVQIITSSHNAINTQPIISQQQQSHTSTPHTETIVINSGQAMNQSSHVHTIHQGNLMNTQHQQQIVHSQQHIHQQPSVQPTAQIQQQRPIQMTLQPQQGIQIMQQQQQQQQNQAQQQMDAHVPVMPQLTGGLTLSFSEDGRLILKHNPNVQQDAQSQMILQAILSGALCNVTLINEPLLSQTCNSTVLVKTADNGIDTKSTPEKHIIVS